MNFLQLRTIEDVRRDANEIFLKARRAKLMGHLTTINSAEKNRVIKHIDSFLHVAHPNAKIFWLKVRREIEKQIEQN